MFLQICRKLQFPEESLPVLESAYRAIMDDPEAAQSLQTACESLLTPDCNEFLKITPKIAEKVGIHLYTVDMVLLVYAVEPLRQIYEQMGLPEKVFWETMEDLRFKLIECAKVHKIWGTSVAFWQKLFFERKCFKLGRLQFETTPHFCEVSYKGIKKGDPILSIHIPTDGPLCMDAVMDSLKQAYAFFKDRYPDGVVPFVTHTWLLYPPYMNGIFSKDGNVQKFATLFHILSQNIDEEYRNFPAVFGCEYKTADFSKLPQKTSLQRNLLAYLRQGNPMGQAYGIFFYNENGIVE